MILFYVYEYCDPRPAQDRIPIYVGEGHGQRSEWHLRNADNLKLSEAIAAYRAMGLEPIIQIVKYFESEAEAFAFEKQLIAQYGRRDRGTGTLFNLTDGGEGCSGLMFNSPEYRERRERREQHERERILRARREQRGLEREHRERDMERLRELGAERLREQQRELELALERALTPRHPDLLRRESLIHHWARKRQQQKGTE